MLGTGLPIPYSNHTQDNELIVQATEKGILGGAVCVGGWAVEPGIRSGEGWGGKENGNPGKCLLTQPLQLPWAPLPSPTRLAAGEKSWDLTRRWGVPAVD